MKAVSLLAACFFPGASFGSPSSPSSSSSSKQTRQAPDPGDPGSFVFAQWAIVNFDAGCSPGGCILTFNMSSTTTASEPGTTASCTVNGDELYWQQCDSSAISSGLGTDGRVWTMPRNAEGRFDVSIQHRFVNNSRTPARVYNVTGNLTVDFETVRLPANFTVMPASVSET